MQDYWLAMRMTHARPLNMHIEMGSDPTFD